MCRHRKNQVIKEEMPIWISFMDNDANYWTSERRKKQICLEINRKPIAKR